MQTRGTRRRIRTELKSKIGKSNQKRFKYQCEDNLFRGITAASKALIAKGKEVFTYLSCS